MIISGCVSFLNQMLSQNRRPSEIVIVDGGSMDGTWECLRMRCGFRYPLRALQENGCNIARGRNLAIAAASHELIVSTDIGCRWSPEWIEELTAPMDKDPGIEAVMGSWAIDKDDIKGWARVELARASGSGSSPRHTRTLHRARSPSVKSFGNG
jgi:glycosyltransferase involved in cell wall biosynthesis